MFFHTNNNHNNNNRDALLEIDDINQLRSEIKSLYELLSHQKVHIKNLEFGLEMEQGQVNILQHNNQTLRKRAVDMVNKIFFFFYLGSNHLSLHRQY
jgi:hypothetical protein